MGKKNSYTPEGKKGVGRKIKHTMRKLDSKIGQTFSLKKVDLCSGQKKCENGIISLENGLFFIKSGKI